MKTTNADLNTAKTIAKSRAGGRYYGDDVIGDAYLAVAQGVTGRRGIENAIRRSMRKEWAYADRHVSMDVAEEYNRRPSAPARAYPDIWGAVTKLPPRQRQAIQNIYVYGLTQARAAKLMGITAQAMSCLLDRALLTLKKFLVGGG